MGDTARPGSSGQGQDGSTRQQEKQEKQPADPSVTEVAPEVLRAQLPIQMPGLGHVNCYLLLDRRGAAVVDPGLPGPMTWRHLRDRLGQAGLRLRDVHTVLVTHSHPDHFGSARRLAEASGAELIAHADFQRWGGRPGGHRHGGAAVTRAGGTTGTPNGSRAPAAQVAPWGGTFDPGRQGRQRPPLARRLRYRAMRSRLVRRYGPPEPSGTVRDGDHLQLAGREWVVVHTPGHTADHICIVDPAEGVLLSGDHVLPSITPHISGVGVLDDPLAEFLHHLDEVAGHEAVELVLPAHGHPFDDLPGRVAEIKDHHEDRLTRLRTAAAEAGEATVEELSHELFPPRSWGSMAESETYAHLEHLRRRGEVDAVERGGLLRYHLVG